jgi:ribonucleoside-diphosphate reductase alpha chain
MKSDATYASHRRRFPSDRPRTGFVRKGSVSLQGGDVEFYLTANFFDDGTLGEVFVKIAKQGSELAGWVDAWAVTVSIALQHGAPWEILRTKYLDQQFGGSADSPSTLHALAASVDELIAERQSQAVVRNAV